uniref:Methyltransferase domain-containing protein n=1 Tax=Candidatus Kentrum sp. DK TaxID=2126562 RepID=A0A450T1G5_9GAMM|nr:MAG: Methyltransferase domain-containing protein [Candidatus Kentron sp. DK]
MQIDNHLINAHYQRIARDYDELYYYSSEFVRILSEKIVQKLQLAPNDVLADIGCGTGMYSLDILKQVSLEQPVICVDPCPEMLFQIPADTHITPIAEDALSFSRRRLHYNKVLIKEMIHHLDRKEEFFRNIHSNLPAGGIMLLVNIPPDAKYPLFNAAEKRFLEWVLYPSDLIQLLQNTGFEVRHDALDFQHRIPKERYFGMVRRRFLSFLAGFSDEKVETGIMEMAARYANTETLEFVIHYDYLTATKMG